MSVTEPQWLHRITHRHTFLAKDGIGLFVICGLRWRRTACVSFQPDLDGAGWHEVPEDEILLERIACAGSPAEAMAVLREATG